MRDYANPVISALLGKHAAQLVPASRRYFRESCLTDGPHKKQLKIIEGRPHRSHVIWIDDLPNAYADRQNGILVPPWRGDDKSDTVLFDLIRILNHLRPVKDVRRELKHIRRQSQFQFRDETPLDG